MPCKVDFHPYNISADCSKKKPGFLPENTEKNYNIKKVKSIKSAILSRVQASTVRKKLSQNIFLKLCPKKQKVLENQGLSDEVVKLTSKDVLVG